MKKRITIRVDEDVLEWFKSQGKGYQSKMNDALRHHTKRVDVLEITDDFKYRDVGIEKPKNPIKTKKDAQKKIIELVSGWNGGYSKEQQTRKKAKK